MKTFDKMGFSVYKIGNTEDGARSTEWFMAKAKLKQHVINREWCKACGICVHFCPKKVLELDEWDKAIAARPQDCVCCKQCEMMCPDLAIEVQVEQN